ncbi:MAG: mannose-6-phosphate isomerase [Candidatus Aenigmatarchaeota archaeon]
MIKLKRWGVDHLHSLDDDGVVIKTLIVLPNECTSLQYHRKRFEFWHAVKPVKIIKKGKEIILKSNACEVIPKECEHRIIGIDEPSIITEVCIGEFSEDDIVRLEDKYGRVNRSNS